MKYAEYVITIHIDESKLQDIEVENYLDTYITEMEDVLKDMMEKNILIICVD